MTKPDNGKGSDRRPKFISDEELEKNWKRAMRQRKPKKIK